MQSKVFVSWSGGKDSYLSLIKSHEAGLCVSSLVSFIGPEGRSMSHGVECCILEQQAASLGLPLEVERVTWEGYEVGFLKVMSRLAKKKITGGVFGDINIAEHREWVIKNCTKAGLKPYLPLWNMEESKVITELLNRGAQLVLVALRNDLLDEIWLGRKVDLGFLELCKRLNISPCGERGEYHTFATGGPLFKNCLKIRRKGIHRRQEHSFLNFVIEQPKQTCQITRKK